MMLLPKTAFQDSILPPFIIQKEDKKNPEGNFIIYFFSKVVMERDKTTNGFKKFYRFCQLRYEKQPARFRSRKDAEDAARYRLGLDPEPTK